MGRDRKHKKKGTEWRETAPLGFTAVLEACLTKILKVK